MTPAGWVGIAVAVLLLVRPASRSLRLAGLAHRGRLAAHPVMPPPRAADASRRRGPFGAAAAAALIAGAGLLAVHVGVLVVPVAAAAGVGLLLGRDVSSRRRADARSRDLATAISLLVGELEAGSQPAVALLAAAEVAPSIAELGQAAGVAADGRDPSTVLAASPDPRVQVLGTAWRLGSATGVALAAVLGRVAGDVAAAEEQRRAVGVALAGPRASATLMAGLPLLGIALGSAMGADPVRLLTTGHAGRLLCCSGILLDLAGVLWMRSVMRRAARA